MPELPELEVVRDVLQRRVVGTTIKNVTIFPSGGAIVLRDLTQRGFAEALSDAMITAVARRGKFLIFSFKSRDGAPLHLLLNPKLTGRLQLVAPTQKRFAKTHVI